MGSQVRPMPSFLKVFWSTSLSMTVECTWEPARLGSWSMAALQFSSMRDIMEMATSTSSVCRRGFLPCRYFTFIFWMGLIMFLGMSLTLWAMPARCLRAFSRRADDGPSRGEVSPVRMVPSASSMAAAARPDLSVRSLAATVHLRSAVVILAFFIRRAILFTSASVALPTAKLHRDV